MNLNDKFTLRELLLEVLVTLYRKNELIADLYKEKWAMETKN